MTEKSTQLTKIVLVLSIFGIAIALYVLKGFLTARPIVCLNGGCEAVRKSSASYIYGVPVPTFGLVGYSFLLLMSIGRLYLKQYSKQFLNIMLGIAVFGVGFVTWFTWTEITVIHGICTWCAVSAVNMVVIFGMLAAIFFEEKKYLPK